MCRVQKRAQPLVMLDFFCPRAANRLKISRQMIEPSSVGIAIEFAGTVLAAPTVQIERFPEPEILISGQFDRNSARRLAKTLD